MNCIEKRIAKLTADIEARELNGGNLAGYSAFREIARRAELSAVAAFERDWLDVVAAKLKDLDGDRKEYCCRMREDAIKRFMGRSHFDHGEQQGLKNVIEFLDDYIRCDIARDFPEA